VELLKQASTGPDKAEVVGCFLADTGLEGIGAIKSLLVIPNDRISVTSVNGLLEKLSPQVKETLIAYEGTAVTDSTGNKEIKARFTELSEAEEKVALMKRLASTDPFVDNTGLQASLKELDALARRLRVTQEGTTPPRHQAVVVKTSKAPVSSLLQRPMHQPESTRRWVDSLHGQTRATSPRTQ
jgi:hypothetical protein